jgi:hypothetical protein
VEKQKDSLSMTWDTDEIRECVAHHEAGHIVVAASQKLKLLPDGLSIDSRGAGLACFCKEPGDTDCSRERVILATFAGFKAQERFCAERSCPLPERAAVWGSQDWIEARGNLVKLSQGYTLNKTISAVQSELEGLSENLVGQHWPAIKALAATLLGKEWKPVKALVSGSTWSDQPTAKYLPGAEAAVILKQFGIVAVCDLNCRT